jgi:two-component system, NtrC family, sensor histidine kinase HydH
MTATASASSELQDLRDGAMREIFRLPRWAHLAVTAPAMGVLVLYLILNPAIEPWRRVLALVHCLLFCLIGALSNRLPPIKRVILRSASAILLVTISGGLASPIAPGMLMVAVFMPVYFEERFALGSTVMSVLFVWTLAGLQVAHTSWIMPRAFAANGSTTYTLLFASCSSTLIVAGYALGRRIRSVTDAIFRRSYEARDELLHTHVERMREMTTYSAEMAHELKNPLASIKGLTALMELEPERVPERLAVMKKEIERLHGALEHFLNFSRPMSRLTLETIDLRNLVLDVVDLHEGVANDKQIDFDTSSVDSVEARCDPRKLKQVLVNLVQNAIDASPAGSTVELTLSRSAEKVRLGVLDRGPGVAPEAIERMFQPGVTTKAKGCGLGLTIVRSLVDQQQGTISLENREGGGLAANVDLMVECPRQAGRELC